MSIPSRLQPLLEQFDGARERLGERMIGPTSNSGDGSTVEVPVMTDDE
ncbi:hypothetical protein [Subtercola endophyticus]|nr:hypothetical protein [Subtercola endophyticus]UFS58910.1 hypothetical protein LQ955_18245 [Subtercola endophyticus]